MRLRNFGVTGGAFREGALDPCAKGQEIFTKTAAGEPERGCGGIFADGSVSFTVEQELCPTVELASPCLVEVLSRSRR
jgi:hypothetical protein